MSSGKIFFFLCGKLKSREMIDLKNWRTLESITKEENEDDDNSNNNNNINHNNNNKTLEKFSSYC